MTISKLNVEMDHISSLADLPLADNISTAELKARFDMGNRQIKQYLNEVLLPELETELAAMREQLRMLSLPQDICYRVKRAEAQLNADGWLPEAESGLYCYSIADADIRAEMEVLVQAAAADVAKADWGRCFAEAYEGGFTLRMPQKPQSALQIKYFVLGVG